MKRHRAISWLLAATALGICLPAAGQNGIDPIGAIRRTAPFEGGHGVMVGRDASGHTTCYFREQGDTHQLDIGIGALGAFVRLDTPEPRDATARNPVKVFAGEQQIESGKATDRFKALDTFTGPVRFYVPRKDLLGFVIVAGGEPAAFLAVVAAARRNFLVVESRQPPADREYVGVGDFDRPAVDALVACARRHAL